MKTAVRIFRRDMRRLFHNFIALFIVVGICLLPSLYAWANIYANMDPYENTSGIQIAVVNEDTGVKNELMGSMDIGGGIVSILKKNKKLGWTFVNREQAMEGVRSGEYYASIVIPKDFSKDFASIFSKNIHQPSITYYSNQKKNAVASKITDTGVTSVKNSINDEFIAAASETVANVIKESALTGEKTISQEEQELVRKLKKTSGLLGEYQALTTGFSKLTDGSDTTISDSRKTLSKVTRLSNQAADAIDLTVDMVSGGRKSLSQFDSYVRGKLSGVQNRLQTVSARTVSDIGNLNGKVQTVTGQTSGTIDRLKEVNSRHQEIMELLEELSELLPSQTVTDLLQDLVTQGRENGALLNALEEGNTSIRNISQTVSDTSENLNGQFDRGRKALNRAGSVLENDAGNAVSGALDSASDTAGTLSGLLRSSDTAVKSADTILDKLNTTLKSADRSLDRTTVTIKKLRSQLSNIISDLRLLESSQTYTELVSTANGINAEQVRNFMSSPVQIVQKDYYPVANYGTGVTPFYTNLAIWVGGLMLVAIIKQEVDRDEEIPSFKPMEGYFGRWIMFAVCAVAQGVVVCLGDILLLGIHCEYPGLFVAVGGLIGFVYVNLIYALSATFKHVGKAINVLLVIVQIPGSSGTYPIEMYPAFFQRLNPWLPFTYGITAMRETIAGIYPHHLAQSLLVLLCLVLPISLVIGLGLRPLFLNLNYMFDHKLAETEMMVCEKNGIVRERKNLAVAMHILQGRTEFRKKHILRMERFEEKYNINKKLGLLMIILIPVAEMVLMFAFPYKMMFLMIWIFSIIGIVTYLLILEYIHENLDRQKRMSDMTPEELLYYLNENEEKINDYQPDEEETWNDPWEVERKDNQRARQEKKRKRKELREEKRKGGEQS